MRPDTNMPVFFEPEPPFETDLMKSMFCYSKEKGILLGREAYEILLAPGPYRKDVVWCNKRFMKYPEYKFSSGGREFYPSDVAGFILNWLRSKAEEQLGLEEKEITKAVVTVPAYFNFLERSTTKLAAEQAGNIGTAILLDEPVAAALSMIVYEKDMLEQITDQLLLVVDLGGGTFDVTLIFLSRRDGTLSFHELGRDGDSALGGINWDEEVARIALGKSLGEDSVKQLLSYDHEEREKVQTYLFEHAEKAKIEFCTDWGSSELRMDKRELNWQHILGNGELDFRKAEVSRKEFQRASDYLIKYVVRICDRLMMSIPKDDLEGCGLSTDPDQLWKRIDCAYVVGGGSKVLGFRESIIEKLGDASELKLAPKPQHAVVTGAAVYASFLESENRVPFDIKLRSPHTTGIWVRTPGSDPGERTFYPLITRNTALPYYPPPFEFPVHGEGTSLPIEIVEERISRFTDELYYEPIGELPIDGLPRIKADGGEILTCTLRYSEQGDIKFTAAFRDKVVETRLYYYPKSGHDGGT